MELLTFGQVFLFDGSNYVWLVPDIENDELHVARILNENQTMTLEHAAESAGKKLHSDAHEAPVLAYVVLTTRDFEGLAAHLYKSNENIDKWKNFPIKGSLDKEDIEKLRKRILDGTGLPPRLVNLVKKLG